MGGPKIIINGLFSVKEFSGMSELYRGLNVPDASFYYVSGSPKILEEWVQSFLEFNNYPQASNLSLRKLSVKTYDYKLAVIRELILKIKPDKIVLIGDDTESDPEVYDMVSRDNITKIEGIYIRSIQNRNLPINKLIKTFFSSVEIATFELLKGNLSLPKFNKITSAFINQDNFSDIVIEGRYCPLEGRKQIEELKHQFKEQSVIDSLNLTQQKIMETCRDLENELNNDD